MLRILTVLAGLMLTAQSYAHPVCDRFRVPSEKVVLTHNPSVPVWVCRFGEATVDVSTLHKYRNEKRVQAVVDRYEQNRRMWPKDCFSSAGHIVHAYNENGIVESFCQYWDASMMELDTFNRGITDRKNRAMNRALGL